MPKKYSYGQILQKRVKRLLEALLDFVNGDLPELELKDLNWRWKQEDISSPELVVETKLRTLILLTKNDSYNGELKKEQINPILTHYLKDFLQILSDNRTVTQGSEDWRFTLKLWSKEKSKNLQKFDEEWKLRQPQKSSKETKDKQQEKIKKELSQSIISGVKKLDLSDSPTPTNLLRAEFGVVPFIGREDALEHMLSWCKLSLPFSMNILHGQAGMGKTRLMREVCVQLDQEGWLTGFFRPKENGTDTDETSFQKMLGLPFPFLLIIDYTENQYSNLEALLGLLRERDHKVQFRLVLIVRQLGLLEKKIYRNYIYNGIFPEQLFLRTQLIDIEQKHIRAQLFNASLKAFHTRINPEDDFQETFSLSYTRRDFSGEALGRPLIIQLTALVEVLGYQETELDRFFYCLISHEERYWIYRLKKLYRESPNLDRIEESFKPLVAINTLLGGQTREKLKKIAEQMPTVFNLETSEIRNILEVLAQCYKKESSSSIIDSLQPDMIGEWLIANVLNEEVSLLQNLLNCLEHHQIKQVFDVINRTAEHFSDAEKWLSKGLMLNTTQFAPIILTVASETGGEAAKAITKLLEQNSLDPDTIKQLENTLPKYTIDLREARVLIVEKCLSYLTEHDDISERARLLAKLSAYLLELDRLDEAQRNALKAAEFYETIAQSDSNYRSNLAFSINIYAVALQRSGKITEAEKPARKAVELYQNLVQDDDTSLNLKLANSQNTLATILGETGAFNEALTLIDSASCIYHKYRESNNYAYTVELASCLNNKALLLRHLERLDEALKTAEQATSFFREFIKDKQGQCHSELAASLTELANRYYELGQLRQALETSEEAEQILRSLAERKPDIFKKHLAKTLLNQAIICRTTGKKNIAIKPAQQAVDLYQELFNSGSREIAYELITAMSNLGDLLREQRKYSAAKELLYRAIALIWDIQNISDEFSLSFVANSVVVRHHLSLTLMNLGDYNEALEVSGYALRLLIPQFENNRSRYFVWMHKLVANYKNACIKSGHLPAEEFIHYLDI